MTVLNGLAMLPGKGTLTGSKALIEEEFISTPYQKQNLLNLHLLQRLQSHSQREY
jgi:hypothetical protein